MKKSSKIYLGAWIATIAITLLVVSPTYYKHSRYLTKLSEYPEYLEKVVDVDLSDITTVESDYGVGSIWRTYYHKLDLGKALSDDCIKQLEMRCKALFYGALYGK